MAVSPRPVGESAPSRPQCLDRRVAVIPGHPTLLSTHLRALHRHDGVDASQNAGSKLIPARFTHNAG
jgi:hypothetical protein